MHKSMILAMVWAGCTSDTPAEVSDGPKATQMVPVNVLSKATEHLWLQEVWFVGAPGERVEGVGFSVGKTTSPVLSLVAADDSRRAVVVTSPGRSHEVSTRIDTVSRKSQSTTSPGAGKRVTITQGEKGTTVRSVGMAGQGSVDVLADPAGPELVHPSIDPKGRAVYVERPGKGIVRLALDGSDAQLVVREEGAAAPLSWPMADEVERIVYADQVGSAPVLIVAVPVPDGIVAATAGMDLAPSYVAADRLDAGWAVFEGCDGVPTVPVTREGTAYGLLGLRLDQALPGGCGSDCTSFLMTSPSGAPRVAVSAAALGGGVAWDFSPAVEAQASGRWLPETEAATAPRIAACAPALPPDLWLEVPRVFGGPQEAYQGIEVERDRLMVHGTRRGKQQIAVHVPHNDRGIRAQLTRSTQTFEKGRVVRSEDGVEVVAKEGGLTWISEGQPSEFLPTSAERTIGRLALSADLGQLVFDDAGKEPGIWWVDVAKAEMRQVVKGGGKVAPVLYEARGKPQLAYLSKIGGRAALVSAEPLTAADREAWQAGPRTLAGRGPAWSAVQPVDRAPTRCTGFEVKLDLMADGGPALVFGSKLVRVHAAFEREDGVHFVAPDAAGAPVVVATLSGTDELTWKLRVPDDGWVTSATWRLAAAAEGLAKGERCRKR